MQGTTGNLTFLDLLKLVASDEGRARSVIEKAFEWEHVRRLEVGKWFLATGAALIISTIALVVKETPPPVAVQVAIEAIGAILITVGLGAFLRARLVAARLSRLATLVARLEEIRPFLIKLKTEGAL